MQQYTSRHQFSCEGERLGDPRQVDRVVFRSWLLTITTSLEACRFWCSLRLTTCSLLVLPRWVELEKLAVRL